jgi:hypothetical protein
MARTILSFLSVLHHETTHLALAVLFFRRPRAFLVKEREGFVIFTGNDDNFLIYLGPYFIPIAVLLWLPTGMIFRPELLEIYVGVLGFLTGYGLGQSLGDFRPDQPDICHVGLSFSILFCTTSSLMLVGFSLAVAANGFDGGIHFLSDGLQTGYWGISKVCASSYQLLNQFLALAKAV